MGGGWGCGWCYSAEGALYRCPSGLEQMFGIFKREESKKIKELNEKVEELEGNIGKMAYELQSLRNRYNKQLGSVAQKMRKSEEEEEEEVQQPKTIGKFAQWVKKLSPQEQEFLANSSPHEVEQLKAMVEEGLV